jgi:hypothetical protein
MSDDVGWENQKSVEFSLDSIPPNWDGWTRASKVQRLLDVVQEQLRKVRCGTFNATKGERVAALALEGQMELVDFYADAEASARHAKHSAEYAEGEVAAKYAKAATDTEHRVSEASLKRVATISDEVKTARREMVDLEKEYKKWKYVFETLKEAHIFFRNIGKL